MSDGMNRRDFLGAVGAAASSLAFTQAAHGETGSAPPPALADLGEPPPGGCAEAQIRNRAGPARLQPQRAAITPPPGRIALQPFDYRGVVLGPSRWQQQYASARDFYLGLGR